jgi:hypothetical protein
MPSWPAGVLVVLRYCYSSGLQLTLDTLARQPEAPRTYLFEIITEVHPPESLAGHRNSARLRPIRARYVRNAALVRRKATSCSEPPRSPESRSDLRSHDLLPASSVVDRVTARTDSARYSQGFCVPERRSSPAYVLWAVRAVQMKLWSSRANRRVKLAGKTL